MSHDNNMKGAIWKNDKREKDTHPHFKGDAEIDGVQYWVSAWKRDDGGNPKAPALKFSFTKKEAKWDEGNQPSSPQPAPADDFDDDIGF